MITTIIPALNEELHIERSVNSAKPLGPVFVLDSGSSDKTRELAEAAGAIVVDRPWLGYARQKNWALDNLPLETPWVFFLDADEWLTNRLVEEFRASLETFKYSGYYVPRRTVFMGRTLMHATWYPDYQLRLFKKNAGRYEDRDVHEHVLLEGEAGFIRAPMMHGSLKGVDDFLRRHERYASLEAQEIRLQLSNASRWTRRGSFFGSWPERRRALKVRIWYRLPGRPAIRFFWMYVVKRGFLDGRQGLVYCQLLAAYEAMIDAKLLELQQSV